MNQKTKLYAILYFTLRVSPIIRFVIERLRALRFRAYARHP
jgi:hypothetical protein